MKTYLILLFLLKIVYSDCGDGILNLNQGEVCDDGNNIDGDGCSGDCLHLDNAYFECYSKTLVPFQYQEPDLINSNVDTLCQKRELNWLWLAFAITAILTAFLYI